MDDDQIRKKPTLVDQIRNAEVRHDHVVAILSKLAPALSLGTSAEIATLAGRDAADRQRIKRKAERWRHGFGELESDLERIAILRAIVEACMDDDSLIPDIGSSRREDPRQR